MLQYSGNPKISNFNISLWSEKNVLGFKIAMQYFFIMDIVESEGHLYKPCDYLMFWEECAYLFLSGYFVEHVATLAVVHDYAEAPL